MATLNRVPRVLYFHRGMVPTPKQYEDGQRFAPNVGFRNADQVGATAHSPLEECDAVAGDVPERYAAVYPNVSGVDTGSRLLRMSDLDRAHGPVNAVDNEAARAAKPPALNQDRVMSQGATRPAGAQTMHDGGFVAPVPGNPDNLHSFGSERAENGVEGPNREAAQGSRLNPQGLSDKGVTLPTTGSTGPASGPVAEGGGQDGFRAPTPPAEDEVEEGPKSKAKAKGSTGDTGATG